MKETKSALVLEMTTAEDEEKLVGHPEVRQKETKKSFLDYICVVPSEMKDDEVAEEVIERKMDEAAEEQKKIIKSRFKTEPLGERQAPPGR